MYFIPNLSKFRCATPSISPTVTIFVPKTIDFAPKRPPESSVQPTFMIMVSSATRIMEAVVKIRKSVILIYQVLPSDAERSQVRT